jgi:hypothetical protein
MCAMAPKQTKQPSASGIRFTPDDRKFIDALKKQLGVDTTQIIRLGIRALAQKEGVQPSR